MGGKIRGKEGDKALAWPGEELSWVGGGMLLVHSKLPGPWDHRAVVI